MIETPPITIEFCIYGHPAVQGSKIAHAIYHRKGQPAMTPDGRVKIVQRDSCKNLLPWRKRVGEAARDVYGGDPIKGEFGAAMTFALNRPKNHYRSGKYSRILKDDAPRRPITRPDTLKMARAIEDALAGIIYTDDSCIVHHSLWKEYVEWWEDEYAAIEIWQILGDDVDSPY